MFYTTLRRYAVGTKGAVVSLSPSWSPPGSVAGVVLLYAVGAGLAALVVLGARTPRAEQAAEPAGGAEPAPIAEPALVAEPTLAAEAVVIGEPIEAVAVTGNGNGNGNGKAHAEELMTLLPAPNAPEATAEDGPGGRGAAVWSSAS